MAVMRPDIAKRMAILNKLRPTEYIDSRSIGSRAERHALNVLHQHLACPAILLRINRCIVTNSPLNDPLYSPVRHWICLFSLMPLLQGAPRKRLRLLPHPVSLLLQALIIIDGLSALQLHGRLDSALLLLNDMPAFMRQVPLLARSKMNIASLCEC
ncbi:hypothetical protein D3C78_797310 [compost metagenome]